MSKTIIIVVIGFLAVVYIFAYLSYKKKKKANMISGVEQFHNTYLMPRNNKFKKNKPETRDYQAFITKYNSQEDYREKDAPLDDYHNFY